jgi:phosphoenolpyruvate carboxykinase (ATP)
MHASANCLADGSHSCVIFGLSGTGKTTLSAQDGRYLIGDDESAWSQTGLTNLEGGCYAKLVNLTPEKEPEIFSAVNRFCSILENVAYDPSTRVPDFSSVALTENTRGSYKLNALERVFSQTREADLPETIVFLTADAFGALPAVARLDEWQMRYHFMSGFTAKVAGTEMGLKEPKAAFSACFGAPFMPRSPSVYANLLAERARESGASVWLLNTGWVGGYQKGSRFPLPLTRRILEMIQNGELQQSKFTKHPIFGFDVPTSVKGIDQEILMTPTGPQVEELAKMFIKNQEKFKDADAQEIIARGGPTVGPREQVDDRFSSQRKDGDEFNQRSEIFRA